MRGEENSEITHIVATLHAGFHYKTRVITVTTKAMQNSDDSLSQGGSPTSRNRFSCQAETVPRA